MSSAAAGMPHLTLEELSPSSRVWVFGSADPLDDQQKGTIEAALREFLRTWKAHGQALRAAVEIRDWRFVIIAADDAADPSGCSIDSLFGTISSFQKLGANLLDSTLVFYRTGEGDVRSVDRATFKKLVTSGAVNATTPVFDLTAASLAEVRSGLEKPAGKSWHARAFGL